MKKIILIICMMFLFIPSVCASENTLQDVVDTMKTTEVYKMLDSSASKPSKIEVNEDCLVITSFLYENGYIIKLNYANGVLSWKFTGDKNNSTDVDNIHIDLFYLVDVVVAVGMLNGYTEKEMMEWVNNDSGETMSFSENGLEMKMFDYKFVDGNSSSSGTIVEEFRIDINRFNVGDIDVSKDEENKDDIVANSEVLEIGTDYVKFKVTAAVSNDENCYLYRSSSKDDLYDDLHIIGRDCNTEFVDEDVEPGKTYYYRTLVEDNDTYGEIITVTTKSTSGNTSTGNTNNNNNSADKDNNVVVNPQTGFNLTAYISWILLCLAVIYIAYFTKKYLNEN